MTAADGPRADLIDRLAVLIARRIRQRTVRVAIDGVDAAGKTTLADDLAPRLRRSGVAVVRASIDGFHHPAAVRHRRADAHPARSYYEDSFDYAALRDVLLDPLRLPGECSVRTRIFDVQSDRPIERDPERVQPGSVLLFDGVFLLRPELDGCWDLSVFLHVEPEISLQRALRRDLPLFGTAAAIEQRYRKRYLPGQAVYLSHAQPGRRADVLIDNTDPVEPRILRIPPA